jgi:4-hydroxy-3-methylbut-2-en-1-yl diphosphate synthase IspG/GcpE
VQQVMPLARAGSELVRVTVNNDEAAAPFPVSSSNSDKQGSAFPSSATSTTTATFC